MCDDTVCVCEDEGGRVVSNQTLGCVMIQCVYVKMKGKGCKQSNTWMYMAYRLFQNYKTLLPR